MPGKGGVRASSADVLDERELCRAIRERRLVEFVYDGCRRIAEPHDYGIIDGERRLFFHQVAGESRSGRPVGWRLAFRSGMSRLVVLERGFQGARPAPSGRHIRWDALFASVSKEDRRQR